MIGDGLGGRASRMGRSSASRSWTKDVAAVERARVQGADVPVGGTDPDGLAVRTRPC